MFEVSYEGLKFIEVEDCPVPRFAARAYFDIQDAEIRAKVVRIFGKLEEAKKSEPELDSELEGKYLACDEDHQLLVLGAEELAKSTSSWSFLIPLYDMRSCAFLRLTSLSLLQDRG